MDPEPFKTTRTSGGIGARVSMPKITAPSGDVYEKFIKRSDDEEPYPTLFDERYIDDGPNTDVSAFESHKIGEIYTLSCPICEAPMEALLTNKHGTTYGVSPREEDKEYTYSIRTKECDCPVVVFAHSFLDVKVEKP